MDFFEAPTKTHNQYSLSIIHDAFIFILSVCAIYFFLFLWRFSWTDNHEISFNDVIFQVIYSHMKRDVKIVSHALKNTMKFCCGNNISDFHTQGPSSPFILLLLLCMEVLSNYSFFFVFWFLVFAVVVVHRIDFKILPKSKLKSKNSKRKIRIRDHKCTDYWNNMFKIRIGPFIGYNIIITSYSGIFLNIYTFAFRITQFCFSFRWE